MDLDIDQQPARGQTTATLKHTSHTDKRKETKEERDKDSIHSRERGKVEFLGGQRLRSQISGMRHYQPERESFQGSDERERDCCACGTRWLQRCSGFQNVFLFFVWLFCLY